METVNRDDEFFMRQAINEARLALNEQEVPIGAVVVCGGKVVGRGHNMTQRLSDATAHAEMQALTAASATLGGKYLSDCTLYVTVEPCVMCAGACSWAQIGRIVYGAGDAKRGFLRFGRDILHPKTQLAGGILESECGGMVSLFFEKKRHRVARDEKKV